MTTATTTTTTDTAAASGTSTQKYQCFVLCLHTSIPSNPPAPPSKKLHKRSNLSGILRPPFFALALSYANNAKVIAVIAANTASAPIRAAFTTV